MLNMLKKYFLSKWIFTDNVHYKYKRICYLISSFPNVFALRKVTNTKAVPQIYYAVHCVISLRGQSQNILISELIKINTYFVSKVFSVATQRETSPALLQPLIKKREKTRSIVKSCLTFCTELLSKVLPFYTCMIRNCSSAA